MAKEGRHNIWCYYGQLWWHWDKWASRKFPALTITKPWRQHRALQRRRLAIFNTTPRDTENIKKEICGVFNQNGLRITIEANKQIINFLDVTFNLDNSTYQPFTHRSPQRTYLSVSTDGCHPFHWTNHHSTKSPPHIKKHSTKADTTTLKTTNPLQLLNGETDNATTSPGTNPHSANVNTNIGHRFLTLVDKHFPKENKLRKIFNRNTIKISYSCMNNTKEIVDNHNKRILNSSKHTDKSTDNSVHNKSCNCRQKNTCPLNGNCLQLSVIYQETIKRNDNNTPETYIGLTENTLKTRYRNHMASFHHTKHRNSTELSKHVWSLTDNDIDYSISWRIISSSSSYNSSSKRCNLCLKEKFLIICHPDLPSLNKHNKLVSSCRHRNKELLHKN